MTRAKQTNSHLCWMVTLGIWSSFLPLQVARATTPQGEAVVNIYSSRHYDVDQTLFERFTADTGIRVQEVQIKEAGQLIERVKSEGAKSPVDVILTVDVGNLWRAEEADILAAEQIPALEKILTPDLRHPEGKWYAVSKRARVIVYNKAKVQPNQLKSYQDLTNGQWKGKVLVRSSTHVYNQSLIASMLHHDGLSKTKEWVAGITSNLARRPEGGDTDQIKAVANGTGDVAIVNSYYVIRLMKSSKPEDRAVFEKIGVVFPDAEHRGTHINISGAAIARHAPNMTNAKKLIEFLLSDWAQKELSNSNGEYPASSRVELPVELAKLGSGKFDTTSLAKIGAQTPVAVKLTDQSDWR